MELETAHSQYSTSRLIMAAISAVFTIARAAEMLGEDENWLWDVAAGMDTYDGCLWIYDANDKQTTAFTEDGLDNLKELIEFYKANPKALQRFHSL